MRKILFSCLLYFLMFEHLDASASPSDSVHIYLTMPIKKIKNANDLEITLTITSNQKRIIELPKRGDWGYIDDKSNYFDIQIQKKKGGHYYDMPSARGLIDNLPLSDVDTLLQGQHEKFGFSIALLYHYLKGEYRIRVFCRFSIWNKLNDQYSNWTYFNCGNEVVP